MTLSHLATILSFFLLSSTAIAADLAFKKISATEFELTLTSDISLTVDQAQVMMSDPASTLCAGKIPQYGKYKFAGSENLTAQKSAEETPVFHMIQMLNCVADLPTRPKGATPTVRKIDSDQEFKLKIEGKKLTTAYLSAKENAYYETAYNMLSPSMKATINPEEWQALATAYQAKIGKLVSRDLWRVTVYDNPVNSSQPGTYIAVDYETKHSIAPVTCGYVVWFLAPDSKNLFSLMREEYGHISEDIVKSTSASDMGKLRKQMGCKT
ncbi:MAG: DUF4019 domain-containing protein [Undibacterium umbellatum]|uniref:DUF4019 domain-containing protein n=1 Tax=Undibacterium umbellatum TaxID=2762300 RepID=UPI003BB6CE62